MRGKKAEGEIYQINAKYRIDQDARNYILQEKGGHKPDAVEGQTDVWKNIGFYQTINSLYHALVEIGIKDTKLVFIKELDLKVIELHGLIEKMPQWRDKC